MCFISLSAALRVIDSQVTANPKQESATNQAKMQVAIRRAREAIHEAAEGARAEPPLLTARLERTRTAPASKNSPPVDLTSIVYSETRVLNRPSQVLSRSRVVAGDGDDAVTRAYKLLRTQILQRLNENNWNVLAITSPGNSEGKTLTAINLAISIAREVDYTVLLVDANLRQPWMLEKLGLTHRKGLSDYLTDDIPVSELLFRPENINHLIMLPGGSPLSNSAEMLNSPRMVQLADEMKSRYHSRIVIYDLPPVLTSCTRHRISRLSLQTVATASFVTTRFEYRLSSSDIARLLTLLPRAWLAQMSLPDCSPAWDCSDIQECHAGALRKDGPFSTHRNGTVHCIRRKDVR